MYFTLICERCFEINECKTEQCALSDGRLQPEALLIWNCPDCGAGHTVEIYGDVAAAVRKYNDNIRDISAKLEEAIRSRATQQDKEQVEFENRLALAREKDEQAGPEEKCFPSFVQRVKFGEWLRGMRTAPWKELTKEQAARAAGISKRQWHRYEMGECRYDEPMARRLNSAVDGMWPRASEVAGFGYPEEEGETPEDVMLQAVKRYVAALESQNDAWWLIESLMARKQYRQARYGEEYADVVGISDRSHALDAMMRAVRAIRKLEKPSHWITVLRAALRTEAVKTERYNWIKGMVLYVLTDGQKERLSGELRDHLKAKLRERT